MIPIESIEDGCQVTCIIKDTVIRKAKLRVKSDGDTYICQDKEEGSTCQHKFGFKYSWTIRQIKERSSTESLVNYLKRYHVKDLEIANTDWDDEENN